MQLNDLVKRIKMYSHRGSQSVTTDQITSDIVLCINDTRRDIVKIVPKRWFWKNATSPISTVNGTSTYSLAAGVMSLELLTYVYNNGQIVMKKIMGNKEWFEVVKSPSAAKNRPIYYREIYDASNKVQQVELFPVPDAVYTIAYEYQKSPTSTELTTADLATEIPDIPDYCNDVLWKGGLYYYLKSYDDQGQVPAQADYLRAVEAMNEIDQADLDADQQFRFATKVFNSNVVNSFKAY